MSTPVPHPVADTAMPDSVLVTRMDGITQLTLNRPSRRNAVNVDVARRLGTALHEADRDPSVRAIVLTGAGEIAFCAGADLRALAHGEPVIPPENRGWGFAGITRQDLITPIIAAVNGIAVGGGLEIVLACDIAIAATNATFGLPEVRVGQLAAAGGMFRLTRQLPPKVAAEMLLTGEPIDASAALRWGLVSRLTEPVKLLDEALSLARGIAANAPLSVRASRRILRDVLNGRLTDDESGWAATDEERRKLRGTHDAAEGAKAFAAKRPPQWQGR